jgi:hypothetical protein
MKSQLNSTQSILILFILIKKKGENYIMIIKDKKKKKERPTIDGPWYISRYIARSMISLLRKLLIAPKTGGWQGLCYVKIIIGCPPACPFSLYL